MSLILDMDLFTLMDLVNACQTASEEIENAEEQLMKVRTHSDWTCKEKNTIDDLMTDCRNKLKQISEQESSFLRAVKHAKGGFGEWESSISTMFDSVEALLAKFLSIPSQVIQSAGGGFADIFKKNNVTYPDSQLPNHGQVLPSGGSSWDVDSVLTIPVEYFLDNWAGWVNQDPLAGAGGGIANIFGGITLPMPNTSPTTMEKVLGSDLLINICGFSNLKL